MQANQVTFFFNACRIVSLYEYKGKEYCILTPSYKVEYKDFEKVLPYSELRMPVSELIIDFEFADSGAPNEQV